MNEQRQQDYELVQRCVGGSQSAWAQIAADHERHIRFTVIQTLRRYGARSNDARVEDLASRILFGIVEDDFRRLRTYSGRASLKTWLRTLASNTTIDFLRKKKELLWVDDEYQSPGEPESSDSPEAAVIDADLLTSLSRVIAELNEEDAMFLRLFYLEELSFEAIGERMGKSAASLYARKHRLIDRVRDIAEELGVIDDFRWGRTAS